MTIRGKNVHGLAAKMGEKRKKRKWKISLTVAGETRVACVKFGVDSDSMLLFCL